MGSPLCVYQLANTFQELRNCVERRVVHDDGSIQAWVDEEHGEGVVTVTSALTPVQ